MRDVLPILENGAAVCVQKADKDAQDCRFAAAGWAENGEEFTVADGKTDVMKNAVRIKGFADIGKKGFLFCRYGIRTIRSGFAGLQIRRLCCL